MADLAAISTDELWRRLWEAGDLRVLLNPQQRVLYERTLQPMSGPLVLECSRRWGKSWTLLVIALMRALQQPRTLHYYFAQILDSVDAIVNPTMQEVILTCPKDMRPRYDASHHRWRLHNGSSIWMFGANNIDQQAKRGPRLTTVLVDEAGEIKDLDELYSSVMRPALVATHGRPRGVAIIAGTPASRAGHAFEQYCDAAEVQGNYLKQTVEDTPHISPEEREAWKMDVLAHKGMDTWLREAYCHRIVDPDGLVYPDWDAETMVRQAPPTPQHVARYISVDVGYEDLSVALFGWHDWQSDVLWVVDELVLHRATSDELARALKQREIALWGGTPAHRRVADGQNITVATLAKIAEAEYSAPRKTTLHAMVNQVRVGLTNGRVCISPTCKVLVSHVKNARWNRSQTKWLRNELFGHYDGAAALNYMVGAVDRAWVPKGADIILPPWVEREARNQEQVWARMLGRRR